MNTPSPLAWQADDHGTLMLHLSSSEGGPYVYLQGRRPYCDRGHWEWGSMGISANHRQAPSYYFMRLDTAQAEVEAWLGRLVGQAHQGPTLADLPNEGRALFQQPQGQDLGWAWAPGDKAHTLNAHALDPASGEPVVLTLTETQGETGPLWTLTQQGVPNADDADRFPRVYLDLGHAQQEAEDFLAWRLLKVACEYPRRFELGESRPLNDALAQALSVPAAPRRGPRP